MPLVLAGAPIGRAGDASGRLAAELATADVVAAEDTRRLHRLCADLGVKPTGKVVSCFEGNEEQRVPELLDAVRAGLRVLLVTDAGMPTVSDPGFRLVAAAAAAGPAGHLRPRTVGRDHGARRQRAAERPLLLRGLPAAQAGRATDPAAVPVAERRTAVLFEAPHRLAASLADMAEVLGEQRRAVVCRELTKTHEEVLRGTLGELAAWAAGRRPRGGDPGARRRPEPTVALTPAELVRLVAVREEAGLTRKEALAAVAVETGLPRRDVFDAVVAAKKGALAAPPSLRGAVPP